MIFIFPLLNTQKKSFISTRESDDSQSKKERWIPLFGQIAIAIATVGSNTNRELLSSANGKVRGKRGSPFMIVIQSYGQYRPVLFIQIEYNSTHTLIPSWANDSGIKCDFVWVNICVFYLYAGASLCCYRHHHHHYHCHTVLHRIYPAVW